MNVRPRVLPSPWGRRHCSDDFRVGLPPILPAMGLTMVGRRCRVAVFFPFVVGEVLPTVGFHNPDVRYFPLGLPLAINRGCLGRVRWPVLLDVEWWSVRVSILFSTSLLLWLLRPIWLMSPSAPDALGHREPRVTPMMLLRRSALQWLRCSSAGGPCSVPSRLLPCLRLTLQEHAPVCVDARSRPVGRRLRVFRLSHDGC